MGDEPTRPNPPARFATLRRFARDRSALVAAMVLVAFVAASIVATAITGYGPTQTSDATLVGPTGAHWLGTDELGRDLASRLLVGARTSLIVAFGSALLAMIVGVPIGIVGGYLGRWLDASAMRVMDVLLAVPTILVALVVVAVLGPSTINLIIAIASASVPQFARLARASTLELRERDFVVAERAMGASRTDIMGRTILPNIVGPIIVAFIVTAAAAVVVAASLSFLGLGVPPPEPTWGAMLQQSKSFLHQNPWYGVFPGMALTLTVLCLDRIGRGLQHAFGTSSEPVLRSNGRV